MLTPLLRELSDHRPLWRGSAPQCILEDPSNQYLYTANFADSTVTGAIINSSTGTLTTLRKEHLLRRRRPANLVHRQRYIVLMFFYNASGPQKTLYP